MAIRRIPIHRRARRLVRASPLLAVLGCFDDPDNIRSVSVAPDGLMFAGIRAPAQTLTVTVIGGDGKPRTDFPVTWTYWVGQSLPLSSTNGVISIQRDGPTTWRVQPLQPGVAFAYANAGGKSSPPVSARVFEGPPVALEIVRHPPLTARSGEPFLVMVRMLDADGYPTYSEAPVTVTIASGNGTLSGTTTGRASMPFADLVIEGTGVFVLRFTSPGLAPATTSPITVTAPQG